MKICFWLRLHINLVAGIGPPNAHQEGIFWRDVPDDVTFAFTTILSANKDVDKQHSRFLDRSPAERWLLRELNRPGFAGGSNS